MSKSILIFNDGTGQGPASKSLSNVYKLFTALPGDVVGTDLKCDRYKVDASRNYHSLYYRGIGIADEREAAPQGGGFQKLFSRLGEKADLFAEEVTGASIKQRVESTLADLQKLWQEGDKVYFCGFSRGASSARISAGLVKEVIPGIEIEYMLVFDTVYSVMGPLTISTFPPIKFFENIDIGSHILNCDHLIAGDEQREMFPVTPVNPRNGIRQILFAGSHSDVGGGADDSSLSDIALNFALDSFSNLGVSFDQARVASLKIRPNPAAKIGWDRLNGSGQTHFPRDISKMTYVIHPSVAERHKAGQPAPIALAQLVKFSLPTGKLVDPKEVSCSFTGEASQGKASASEERPEEQVAPANT